MARRIHEPCFSTYQLMMAHVRGQQEAGLTYAGYTRVKAGKGFWSGQNGRTKLLADLRPTMAQGGDGYYPCLMEPDDGAV